MNQERKRLRALAVKGDELERESREEIKQSRKQQDESLDKLKRFDVTQAELDALRLVRSAHLETMQSQQAELDALRSKYSAETETTAKLRAQVAQLEQDVQSMRAAQRRLAEAVDVIKRMDFVV
jgi:predicted  nucleic acid-binding Zn-ribbon protein